MHQPKRGLVNSLLEPGIDLTDRVDDLYAGPGGWSQALTWGATVDTLWDDAARPWRPSASSAARRAVGPAAQHATCCWTRRTPRTCSRSTRCSTRASSSTRLADGSVLDPASARAAAQAQATERGLTLKSAPAAWSGATIADKVVVAYNGGSEVRDTLAALGFEGRAVTATTLTTALTPDVDVLLVGATLNPATLNAANRAAYDAFLARRGGVVGLGTAGSAHTTNAGLLTATGTAAASLASGVANVVNNGGPVVNGAQPYAWIFPPVVVLGPRRQRGRRADLRRRPAAVGLVARRTRQHQRPGQRRRQGQRRPRRAPAGNGVVLLGTSTITRLHAKGLQPQFGRAILFAAAPRRRRRDLHRRQRRRHRAGDAVADARHAGHVRRVHAGRRERLHGLHHGHVISTAGDAALTVADPARPRPPGQRLVRARRAAAGASGVRRRPRGPRRPPTSR